MKTASYNSVRCTVCAQTFTNTTRYYKGLYMKYTYYILLSLVSIQSLAMIVPLADKEETALTDFVRSINCQISPNKATFPGEASFQAPDGSVFKVISGDVPTFKIPSGTTDQVDIENTRFEVTHATINLLFTLNSAHRGKRFSDHAKEVEKSLMKEIKKNPSLTEAIIKAMTPSKKAA